MQSLSIQFNDPVLEERLLPEKFSKDLILGSESYQIVSHSGVTGAQHIMAGGIRLYYVMAALSEPLLCTVTGIDAFFCLQVLLSGEMDCHTNSASHQFKNENHYQLIRIHESDVTLRFREHAQLRVIVIMYPTAFVHSVVRFFPWIEEILQNARLNKTDIIQEQSLSGVLAEKVFNLLHTPYAPTTEKYFQQLFREILEIALAEYSIPEKRKSLFSLYDISCVHAAKEYIDANLQEQITIAQLARKIGINQQKLKRGFKEIYRIGVHSYRLQLRLTIAKTALEKTTKPIHQIARQAGYRNGANFSAAFKNRYSISPYQYRYQQRSKK